MKIFVAGATGAIGTPLVRLLLDAGHDVVGLTRTRAGVAKLEAAGAQGLIGDALERDALLSALDGVSADVVVHQLTALSKPPMRYSNLEGTNRLRTEGTENLLAAARRMGATRFLTQSFFGGYGYVDHGDGLLHEDDGFARRRGDRADPILEALDINESQVLGDTGIEGIALRYGLFYGEGTGMREALQKRGMPVTSRGGVLPWISGPDAAAATLAALEHGRAGQAYNIADDEPATWRDVMTAGARAIGAKPPRALPVWLLRPVAPMATAIMVDTSMRLATAKAREDLGWSPSAPSYRQGVAQLAAV